MGVVAVYALNDEFKSILRETKNGMINPLTYVAVKSTMVLPLLYIMSLFALAVPGLAVQDFPISSFGQATLLWSILMFCFESFAECLAVWIEDAVLGMLQFMNFWCKLAKAANAVKPRKAKVLIIFQLCSFWRSHVFPFFWKFLGPEDPLLSL